MIDVCRLGCISLSTSLELIKLAVCGEKILHSDASVKGLSPLFCLYRVDWPFLYGVVRYSLNPWLKIEMLFEGFIDILCGEHSFIVSGSSECRDSIEDDLLSALLSVVCLFSGNSRQLFSIYFVFDSMGSSGDSSVKNYGRLC